MSAFPHPPDRRDRQGRPSDVPALEQTRLTEEEQRAFEQFVDRVLSDDPQETQQILDHYRHTQQGE